MKELLIEADTTYIVATKDGVALSGRDADGNHAGFALTHAEVADLVIRLLQRLQWDGGGPPPAPPDPTAGVACTQAYPTVGAGSHGCLVLDFGKLRLPVLLPPEAMRTIGAGLMRSAEAMLTPPGQA